MSNPQSFPYTTRLDIKFASPRLAWWTFITGENLYFPRDAGGITKQTLCKVNDSVVRLGVMQGEYHWHKHDNDDEFFFVLEGHFIIDLEDRSIDLQPQQGFVVPKGIVHRTRAPDRAVILMVETANIVPTGDA